MKKHIDQLYFLRTSSFLQSLYKILLLAATLVPIGIVRAEMIIETTRIIYHEGKRDSSFKISNRSSERNAFVQMWLDAGNPQADPEQIVTPFTFSPAIAKVAPSQSQVVRLIYTGEPLPNDRESIFWFNMLEIPPKSTDSNRLSFSVRTRIKVFFRPKAIHDLSPDNQFDKMSWQLVKTNSQWFLEGLNTGRVYLSFFEITGTNTQANNSLLLNDGGMVGPGERIKFPLPASVNVANMSNTIKVKLIGDYGNAIDKEYEVKIGN